MTIHFYLNNEEETEITSFYDMVSNPFAVNDVVNLNISDNEFTAADSLSLFRRKQVKLIKEGKWVESSRTNTNSPRLTIEYHCELI